MGLLSSTKVKALLVWAQCLVLLSCSQPNTWQPSNDMKVKPEITVGIYERGKVPSEEGTVSQNRWTRWINEHAPVSVTFVPIPRGEAVQKYQLLFASNNAPDLILDFDSSLLRELIANDQLLPLNSLIEQYSPKYSELLESYPLARRLTTESDGNIFTIAQINGLKTNHVMVIRMDWLQTLGLQPPKTEEELYEVTKAFTFEDPDRNGLDDTYGIHFTGLGALLQGLTAGGIRPLDMLFQNVGYFIEEGKLIRSWERVKTALAYQKKLYESGVVDPNFLTDNSGNKAKLDFVNGKLGIYWVSSGIEELYPVMQAMAEQDNGRVPDIQPIALPAGPYGQFNPLPKSPVQVVGAINKNAKHPEAVMQYIEFLLSEDALTTLRYGFENEHFQRTPDGCIRYMDGQKYNQELAWATDLTMISSRIIFGKCNSFASSLLSDEPLNEKYIQIEQEAERLNLNPKANFANEIGSWPTLPEDIRIMLNDGIKSLTDIYNQAIVDSSYDVNQAVIDAQAAWSRAGGLQVDHYYANWFQQHPEEVIFSNEFFTIP